jgi:hypothetical protein
MDEKRLNIVSFNVPYPADYGGVIDVFYKLKALAENNVKIILHTFEYGRTPAAELEKYCEKVYYYQRKTGIRSQLSFLPYIMYSRRSKELLSNLQENDFPILFEGLHTCYYLNHPALANRLKVVRAHNIEHRYYAGLAANTRSFPKKLYFHLEAFRLKKQEKRLHRADYILPLSSLETAYFEEKYGKEKTRYVPLFFRSEEKIALSATVKPYILYHGDLSTPENGNAAKFLIQQLASQDPDISWIFAGKNPEASLLKLVKQYNNVSIQANPEEKDLFRLIREAAVNILYTNQVSGVKLKLLNALHYGQHCLVNREMVAGSGLESLCRIISENPEETLNLIRQCLSERLPEEEIRKREQLMDQLYNNDTNARKIIYHIYGIAGR